MLRRVMAARSFQFCCRRRRWRKPARLPIVYAVKSCQRNFRTVTNSHSEPSLSASGCQHFPKRSTRWKRSLGQPIARFTTQRATVRIAPTHIRALRSNQLAMSHQRILATISRNDFVGRDSELRQLIAHSSQVDARRLLILAAPGVGGSEFLRQAYDELFFRRAYSIPVHFAFGKDRLSARDVAADFFRSFLRQFIAYRRVNPALCNTELTLDDLTNLALPTDYEAIAAVVESFERARTDTDETALLRFCLAAPRRLAVEGKHSFYLLIDCLPLADADVSWAAEVAKAFMHRTERAAVAGLRRHVATLARIGGEAFDDHQVIHVNPLDDEDSRRLIDNLARRLELDSNEQTRDLIAQQASGSTFAIAAVATAAREAQKPLTSFLNC